MKSSWTRLFALIVALLIAVPTASADEPAPAPELSWSQQIDKFFGDYPNHYLAKVLFFDVVFWDDQLPAGEGIGTLAGDERITEYRAGEGYVYQREFELAEPTLVLEEPTVRTLGKVKVELRSGTQRSDAGEKPIVVGKVLEAPVDLAAVELEGAPPETPDAEAVVTVEGLAPFSVKIDRRSGKIVPVDLQKFFC